MTSPTRKDGDTWDPATGVEYFTQVVEDHLYGDGGGAPVVTALMDVLAMHTRSLDQFLADAGRAGIRCGPADTANAPRYVTATRV